jgi:hypothetical protein
MELKHIQGPWESVYGSHGVFDIRSEITFQEPGTGIKYRPLIASIKMRDPVETADTARVISTAPEGVGQAAMILAGATDTTPSPWVEAATNLIKKAEGRE